MRTEGCTARLSLTYHPQEIDFDDLGPANPNVLVGRERRVRIEVTNHHTWVWTAVSRLDSGADVNHLIQSSTAVPDEQVLIRSR